MMMFMSRLLLESFHIHNLIKLNVHLIFFGSYIKIRNQVRYIFIRFSSSSGRSSGLGGLLDSGGFGLSESRQSIELQVQFLLVLIILFRTIVLSLLDGLGGLGGGGHGLESIESSLSSSHDLIKVLLQGIVVHRGMSLSMMS